MGNIQDSLFGRMFPEHSVTTKERTFEPYSKRSQMSVKTTYLFLDLRKTSGLNRGGWQEMDGRLPGGSTTLNTGEFPSVARESTLSQILQANVPQKYFLSAKACLGILTRAKKRGKEIPPMLKEALQEAVMLSKNVQVNQGDKEIFPTTGRVFTLSTNVDQHICYEATYPIEQHQQDARFKLLNKDDPVPTLPAQMGTGGNNTPMCLHVGNGQLHSMTMSEQTNALDCMHDQQAILTNSPPPRKYIIRRLTPLECCRLQGFPDWWEEGVEGSDTARYRMWGNGIALPCAVDVLGRIAKELRNVNENNQM